ncbi:hypothetical protein D9M71_352090 [compost metagenome]
MQKKFITAKELMARYQRSRRTIDRWVAENGFPKPALAGQGVTCMWRVEEVEAWEAVNFSPSSLAASSASAERAARPPVRPQ